jgi:DNA helicase-2/ATP-dependent DNA helicase PcrA
MEEERRLCYVGLTRAMNALTVTRARYRRRYGNDSPEASLPSRFLEEIPSHLLEPVGGTTPAAVERARHGYGEEAPVRHYSYEDEDQRVRFPSGEGRPAKPGNSIDNIARFFSSRGAAVPKSRPRMEVPKPTGSTGIKSGQRVRHPKYGEGVVFRREGDGEDAKVTVQFSKFGVKKLVEKFAQLERL